MGLSVQVGRYDVQRALGKGSTGTVYLARDTFTGREVALKTIEPEVFRDPEFGAVYRSQFRNEASLAGKLRHPHIAAILDALVQEDSGYIAMEYVPGGDLSGHVTPDRLLPVADVLQICFKCCGALEYAFREGIVHSDMYSLGMSLYELLVGKKPFTADSLDALLHKIRDQSPTPPSRLRSELPKSIDAIILRATAKKTEHRYPSWAEFALDLSKAAQQFLPPGAAPDSEKYVALKKVEMLSGLSDVELWELARAGDWARVPANETIVSENARGKSFYFVGKGKAKVTRQGRLLNMIDEGECFGEMAFIRGGEAQRHATVGSATELLLAKFRPDAFSKMSLGAQLYLTRALVRNLADRLELANTRIAR